MLHYSIDTCTIHILTVNTHVLIHLNMHKTKERQHRYMSWLDWKQCLIQYIVKSGFRIKYRQC